MITLLSTAGFLVVLAVLWERSRGNYPRLALQYLCIAPFLPLISLFNHNIDGDRFGFLVPTAPIYTALALLALSLYGWKLRGGRIRLGRHGVYLLIYSMLSLAQVPFSVDPKWSLVAWSFSVPGYALFLIAGRATTIELLVANRRILLLTLIGFVGINLSLIAFGLSTGKATDLFGTRNFGSVFASNSTLAFLMVYGSIVWVAVSGSRTSIWAFSVTMLLGVLVSLSKTALMVLVLYIAFVASAARARSQPVRSRRRQVVPIGGALLTLGVAFVLLRHRLSLDAQLVANWTRRLGGNALSTNSIEVRQAEFAQYASAVRNDNPGYGKGFGTFDHFSIYTDAHNLFITEAFENSLLAAVFLFLAFGLPLTLRSLRAGQIRPFGLSVLGFLAIGQLTGAMLSYRSVVSYYAVYQGWALFLIVGVMAKWLGSRAAVTAAPTQRRDDREVLRSSS